jgi:LysR family glycine cleavage system transcriptional activator
MTRRLPSLNALKAFEAAARHLSFTKAAEELCVSQAAISHQIKALEEDLGVSLFQRLNRALRLTEAARAYLPVLSQAFDEIDRATEWLRPGKGEKGALNVSVSPTFLSRWLIPRLVRWQERHPEIELRVSSSARLVDFSREDFDVGVRHGRGDWPGLRADRLIAARIVPALSPRLLAANPLRTPSDLVRHTLLHSQVEPDAWRMWLAEAGVADQVDASRGPQFDTGTEAIQAAIEGMGVAIVRRALVDRDIKAGLLAIPFEVPLPVEYAFYVVCPMANAEKPKIKAFRDWAIFEARRDEDAEAAEAPQAAEPRATGRAKAPPAKKARSRRG